MKKIIQRPVSINDLEHQFESRGPRKEVPVAVERRFYIAADSEPKVNTRLKQIDLGDSQRSWEVIVEIDGVHIGTQARPAAMKGQMVKLEKRQVEEDQLARHLAGFIPNHIGFNVTPRQWLKSVKRIRQILSEPRIATTVFNPDNRRAFQNTTYPWSTVGQVQTNPQFGCGSTSVEYI